MTTYNMDLFLANLADSQNKPQIVSELEEVYEVTDRVGCRIPERNGRNDK